MAWQTRISILQIQATTWSDRKRLFDERLFSRDVATFRRSSSDRVVSSKFAGTDSLTERASIVATRLSMPRKSVRPKREGRNVGRRTFDLSIAHEFGRCSHTNLRFCSRRASVPVRAVSGLSSKFHYTCFCCDQFDARRHVPKTPDVNQLQNTVSLPVCLLCLICCQCTDTIID